MSERITRMRRSGKQQRVSILNWVVISLQLFLTIISSVAGYPLILTLDEDEEPRCLQFSIPEDDDAHVVIMALPDEELLRSGAIESWYVEQLYKMTKLKSEASVIPRGIPDSPPDNVAKVMSDFLQEHSNDAPVTITVSVQSYEEEVDESQYKAKFFVPLVLNHVRRHHASKNAENYEGVSICFKSHDEEGNMVHMVMDTILVSEEVSDLDVQPKEPGFQKEAHLTPLEQSLEQSIAAARQVLKEYKYMEQREKRMRQTADGINSRVHYFSYVSVAILFGVTYLQVGYLKRYFKKKKLM